VFTIKGNLLWQSLGQLWGLIRSSDEHSESDTLFPEQSDSVTTAGAGSVNDVTPNQDSSHPTSTTGVKVHEVGSPLLQALASAIDSSSHPSLDVLAIKASAEDNLSLQAISYSGLPISFGDPQLGHLGGHTDPHSPGFDIGTQGTAAPMGPSTDSGVMTTAALAAPLTTAPTTFAPLNFGDPSPVVVNGFDTTAFGSMDPAGLAFIPGANPGTGTLLLSDSELDESPFFGTNNLFYLSLSGTFDHSVSLEQFTFEPTGLAFDSNNGHLYISDDDKDGIFEVDASSPAVKLNFFSTRPYATDDEDVVYDSATNHLIIIEGSTGNNNAHTIFETTLTGTLIQSIVLPSPITDPEALAYDPINQLFYVAGGSSADIWVVSRSGQLLDTITVLEGLTNPLSGSEPRPKALLLAPSSDPNDDPNLMSLYVGDYGKQHIMDGRILEIQLNYSSTQPSLFTTANDGVDFNHVSVGSYFAGTQYDAQAGDDTVILPIDAAAAAASGYNPVVSTFHGGDGNDTITGGNLNDVIHGDAGNDTLIGGAGDDHLMGDGGKDTLIGGTGDDVLDGGSSTDTVDYSTASDSVSVDIGLGTATGDGHDTLLNIENATGSNFDDTITGNSSVNTLAGGSGNDILHGGDGNDTLIGGDGLDQLFGDGGNDTLKWDAVDKLDGGPGFDTVDANLASSDMIDLRGPNIVNVERILTGSGNDTVALKLDEVLSETSDHQFIADLGKGTDTLNIDLAGGWTAATANPALGQEAVVAGISVAGMTAYTFSHNADAVTLFTNAEIVHAQVLS